MVGRRRCILPGAEEQALAEAAFDDQSAVSRRSCGRQYVLGARSLEPQDDDVTNAPRQPAVFDLGLHSVIRDACDLQLLPDTRGFSWRVLDSLMSEDPGAGELP